MRPAYNDLIGKTILIGITYLDNSEVEIEKIQFWGTVTYADKQRGIVIKKANDGKDFVLPPDITAISPANPGKYRLRSTGEVIVNPDLLTTWTIKKP